MKRTFVFFNILLICLLGCATSSTRGSVQTFNTADGVFAFSEMFFSHDLINGETEIVFYNIPPYFDKYRERNAPRLYDDYFNVEEFTFKNESFSARGGYLSYHLLITAKVSLLQNRNITSLLSKIFKQDISAGYMEISEMTKNAKRPWAIVLPYKENMYFGNTTNAVASYTNSENALALIIFDLDRKIEFIVGYK